MNNLDMIKYFYFDLMPKIVNYDIINYLNEPLGSVRDALAGWKVLIIKPNRDTGEIEYEAVEVKQWAYFTSLSKNPKKVNGDLISVNAEMSMPLISSDYNGKFIDFFNEIKQNNPNWNGLVPSTMVAGCYHDSFNTNYKEEADKSFSALKVLFGRFSNKSDLTSELKKALGIDVTTVTSIKDLAKVLQDIKPAAVASKESGEESDPLTFNWGQHKNKIIN